MGDKWVSVWSKRLTENAREKKKVALTSPALPTLLAIGYSKKPHVILDYNRWWDFNFLTQLWQHSHLSAEHDLVDMQTHASYVSCKTWSYKWLSLTWGIRALELHNKSTTLTQLPILLHKGCYFNVGECECESYPTLFSIISGISPININLSFLLKQNHVADPGHMSTQWIRACQHSHHPTLSDLIITYISGCQ